MMPLLNLSEVSTLRIRKQRGIVAPVFEVYNAETDQALAFIRYQRRPLRGCATILISVVTFFAFPICVGFAMAAVCDKFGIVNPLGIDQQQNTAITITGWIVVVAAGMFMCMFVGRLTLPRQTIEIFGDAACGFPMYEIRQEQLNICRSLSYTVDGFSDGIVGRIVHHRSKGQLDLKDTQDITIATITDTSSPPEPLEATAIAGIAVFAMIFLVFFSWFAIVLIPHVRTRMPEKKWSLWHRTNRDAIVKQETARFHFDPSGRNHGHIYLTKDESLLPEQIFIIAIAGLHGLP